LTSVESDQQGCIIRVSRDGRRCQMLSVDHRELCFTIGGQCEYMRDTPRSSLLAWP